MASVEYKGRKWISSSHGYRLWLKIPKQLGKDLLAAWELATDEEDEDEDELEEVSRLLKTSCKVPYKGELIAIEQVRTTTKSMYFWITVSKVV